MSFLEELKRRRVLRVGAAYVVAGWVVLQVADLVLDNIPAPDWVMQVLLLLVALGLPVALLLAWAFAWTPEGLRREDDVLDPIPAADGRPGPPRAGSSLAHVAALVVVGGLIGAAGAFGWSMVSERPDQPGGVLDRSLAVLPFQDLSPEGDFQWFADGLSDEIITSITRAPDLQVASRTSSFAFRGDTISTPEIARRLHVAHVLEGSVRRSGNELRVIAQLIGADGFHFWSETYDGELTEAIAIQTSLAEDIAVALQTSMDPEALEEMAEVGTRSVPAYLDYLRGLSLNQQFQVAGDDSLPQRAAAYFDAARKTDPGFWSAHINAAVLWSQELDASRIGSRATGLSAERILAEYRSRLRDAADAADSEAERSQTEALRSLSEGRLTDALSALRRYVELRPADVQAVVQLVELYHITSRTDDGVDALARLRSLSERSERAATEYIDRARKFGRTDGGAFGLDAARRWSGSHLLYQLHRALLWDGRVDDARGVLDRLEAVAPDEEFVEIPRARQACAEGDRGVAEAFLARPSPPAASVSDATLRWHYHMLLGDAEAAHRQLRAAGESVGVVQWTPFLGYAQFDPSYFPDLQALLEREGIDRPPPVAIPYTCPPAGD